MLLVFIVRTSFLGFKSGSKTSSQLQLLIIFKPTVASGYPRRTILTINDSKGDTVPPAAEGRGGLAAKPCQRWVVGLATDRSRTMRHLIRLNSTALLDSLQRNEIQSWCVIDVVGCRIPSLFFGLGNSTVGVHSHSLSHPPRLLFMHLLLSLLGFLSSHLCFVFLFLLHRHSSFSSFSSVF